MKHENFKIGSRVRVIADDISWESYSSKVRLSDHYHTETSALSHVA
jgi:hypothetical protein